MSCIVCAVVPGKRGWIARVGQAEKGPYFSHEIAARVALTEATALRNEGQPTRLAYLDAQDEVRVELCLCPEFARLCAA